MSQAKQTVHMPVQTESPSGPTHAGKAATPGAWPLGGLGASGLVQRAHAAMGLNRGLGNARLAQLMAAPLQRQGPLEEEEALQRQANPEEDELQMRAEPGTVQREQLEDEEWPLQRQADMEDEDLLQGRFDSVQRQEKLEDEEFLQGRITGNEAPAQRQAAETAPENRTGMPDQLKAGLEQFSGLDLSSVRVHHNSSKPAQLNALAYAQGSDIHLGPGQEQHLPHEGWHAVQQMQGRVRPTLQAQGVPINDDQGLEREADVMGAKALQMRIHKHTSVGSLPLEVTSAGSETAIRKNVGRPNLAVAPQAERSRLRSMPEEVVIREGRKCNFDLPSGQPTEPISSPVTDFGTIQRKLGFELELNVPTYGKSGQVEVPVGKNPPPDEVKYFLSGQFGYADLLSTNSAETDYGYKMAADHPGEIRNEWQEIKNGLEQKKVKIGGNEKGLTNLEYITVAYDEHSEEGRKSILESTKNVSKHINETVAAQDSCRNLPSPAKDDVLTGIPSDKLKSWVNSQWPNQKERKWRNEKIIRPLNKMNKIAKESIKLQATVGVLPQDIYKLHAQDIRHLHSGKRKGPDDFDQKKMQKLYGVVRGLLTNKTTKLANSSFKEYSKISKSELIDEEKEVIKGIVFLSLQTTASRPLYGLGIAQYSPKNAVPYLLKTPIGSFKNALPNAIRKNYWKCNLLSRCIKESYNDANFKANSTDYWATECNIKESNKSIEMRLKAYDGNKKDRKINFEDLVDTYLGVGSKSRPVTTGTALPIEAPSENIKGDLGGARLTHFEYRWLSRTLNTGEMNKEIEAIMSAHKMLGDQAEGGWKDAEWVGTFSQNHPNLAKAGKAAGISIPLLLALLYRAYW